MNHNIKSISFSRSDAVSIAYVEDPDAESKTMFSVKSPRPASFEFQEAFEAFAWIAVRVLNMRPEHTQKDKPLAMTMRIEATELFTVRKVVFDEKGIIIVGKAKPHDGWKSIHVELPPIPVFNNADFENRPDKIEYVDDLCNYIDDLPAKALKLKDEAMRYLAEAHERQLTLFSPYDYDEETRQLAVVAG